jgi:hypothetical protein
MYGYLKRHPDGAIRFRTGVPDHESRATPVIYNWINLVFGPNEEELPDNMPTPCGKPFRITMYEDANLMHCLVTKSSMSGIIHLVNQSPVQWFSKKQNLVETATYGSEIMVARKATQQIMDLRYTLRMMGIPLDGPAWMFGDSHSVITSSNTPHSTFNQRHTAFVSGKQSRLRYSTSSTLTVDKIQVTSSASISTGLSSGHFSNQSYFRKKTLLRISILTDRSPKSSHQFKMVHLPN